MVWWLWLLVGVLVGALVGGIVAFALARRRGDAGEIRRLERELERYRGEVGDHFVRTAELVNTLTNDYRAVYEHLERGAYDLVGDRELRRRLGPVEAEPVTLEYLGRRRLAGSGAAGSGGNADAAAEPSDAPSAPRDDAERSDAEKDDGRAEPHV